MASPVTRWTGVRMWLFAHGLRWSTVANLMRTRISQTAAFIPLIGYMILWSENFKEYLQLNSVLAASLWFNPTDRLLLIYTGTIMLAISWVLYSLFCPANIKETPTVDEFQFRQIQIATNLQLKTMSEFLLEKAIQLPEDGAGATLWRDDAITIPLRHLDPTKLGRAAQLVLANLSARAHTNQNPRISVILYAYYCITEDKNIFGLTASMTMFLLGATVLAIPSAEVFFAVISRILLPTIGF